MEPQVIRVWTDGACVGNPGPGGWAYTAHFGELRRTKSGSTPATTNNRMELTAAIEALRSLKRRDLPAVIYSDSKYLVDGVSQYLSAWMARGWRKSDGKPVLNVDLWQELSGLLEERTSDAVIQFVWVKGHSGVRENELVDRLAERSARKAR